jgi:hypothetical protein
MPLPIRHRRVRRTRKGDFELRLPQAERDLLRSLPSQLRELLATDDPSLRRLFPPAYLDDPEKDADYQRLMRDELLDRRRGALDTVEATVDATRLDEEQVLGWLEALNDLRLVLGTQLDVTEELEHVDPDDPRAPGLAVYAYLGWLEEEVVAALEG